MNYHKILYPILLCLTPIFFHNIGYAQTNSFPSSGNVGIGTTNPGALLGIKGVSSGQRGLQIIGSVGNSHIPYVNGHVYLTGDVSEDATGTGNFIFRTYDGSNYDEKFLVKGTTGYVGIGSTSPTAPLSILSPDSDTGLKIGAVGKSTEIKLHVAGGEYGYFNLGGNTVLRGKDNPSYFEGRLGVGTANPTEKLTVNGTAKAEEIIVEENLGADFVFEESYDLSSLSDVEKFIKSQKHLPDIPSAQEMIANGVKVGKLQMKLLQKIEELTLYVIELEKRDRKRERKLIQHQSEIGQLRKELFQLTAEDK